MNVILSGRFPQLISMEGETVSIGGEMVSLGYAELMGIDKSDIMLLRRGYVTIPEKNYLYRKYANRPELMGFLPALLAAIPVVSAVSSGIKSIVSSIKGKKKSSPQNAQQSADTTALQNQIAEMQAQQTAVEAAKIQADQQKKNLMMIGIPAAALLAIMFLKK